MKGWMSVVQYEEILSHLRKEEEDNLLGPFWPPTAPGTLFEVNFVQNYSSYH